MAGLMPTPAKPSMCNVLVDDGAFRFFLFFFPSLLLCLLTVLYCLGYQTNKKRRAPLTAETGRSANKVSRRVSTQVCFFNSLSLLLDLQLD